MDEHSESLIDDAIDVVTGFFGVGAFEIVCRRSRRLQPVRAIAMYLAYKAGAHPAKVGERFGVLDYRVHRMSMKLKEMTETDTQLRRLLRHLNAMRMAATRARCLRTGLVFH